VNLKLAIAFAGGVVTGALVMWRGAGSHFREIADAEIEEMRAFYTAKADEAVENYKEEIESEWERIEAEKYHADPANEVVEGPNGPSFKDDPDLIATTAEAAKALVDYQGGNPFPSPDYTILLTQREYEEGPPDDYDQTTLTYYALDGVLTTPDDKQLEVKKAIGDLDPAWFGEKSDFPDVCYVRNTRLKIDFEVVRSLESYAKTVLGLGDDSG
jgi:hypothetical protein